MIHTKKTLKKYIKILRTGCWCWTGALVPSGYGQVRHGPDHKRYSAHRLTYMLWKGDIPDGLELDHLCRNRWCVNPEHVEPVTHQTNMSRGAIGSKTHCKRGHEFTEENTYIPPGRYRRCCRECDALRRGKKTAGKPRGPRGAYKRSKMSGK